MSEFRPGQVVTAFAWNAEGLGSANWTTCLLKNGVTSTQPVTIAEVAAGFYRITFESDSSDGAVWQLGCVPTVGATPTGHAWTWVLREAEAADVIKQNGEPNAMPGVVAAIRGLLFDFLRKSLGGGV